MKEFVVIDWCVADICNMDCAYCISSETKREEKVYKKPDPQTVIKIANRIAELSEYVKKLTVNLCGGEPLLADNIDQVIEILSGKSNIEIVLITNFKLIDKTRNNVNKLHNLLISLHIKYKTDLEVDKIIEDINDIKDQVNISLSQVNYELNEQDYSKLAKITYNTGKEIHLQTYNLPISSGSKNDYSENNLFALPKGKYCLIGYMFFSITSEGILYYNTWCYKFNYPYKIDFLDNLNEVLKIVEDCGYVVCPFSYCPCNYNVNFYKPYIAEMARFNIDSNLLFEPEIRKNEALLIDRVGKVEIKQRLLLLEKDVLIEKLSVERNSLFELRNTMSWKIGFFITERIKFLFGWTPFIKQYLKNKKSQNY